jgi:hypothetical protein
MNRRELLLSAVALRAQYGIAADPKRPYESGKGWKPLLNGRNTAGWHGADTETVKGASEWMTATAVRIDPANNKALLFDPSPGAMLLNGPKGRTVNLVSDEKFGDCELYAEFLIPNGSNSGIYLQGLYEIQIFDSYGVKELHTSDCGAIYHRWIDNKPVGGSPPKVNASLPPGEWQSFLADFRAPRFSADGRKTENARFERVLQNGKLVQENVSLDGGTRSHLEIPEAPKNPLLLQGDHGPVAFRNVYIRPA